ncbi:type II toxin-antitoxin system VapC family toxin [Enterovirga aerilata]|uniref:Ribonuclease VapC n=1 Tax=Enterovirga aerilata TaxID=2730920 RepID=A0A849I8L5_9HYPH|nr:type II toxin-antitoxin system VapC family toxin [Enterovirga sp. DB1703]NNM72749.1 type II toxin-antitoxin system VapC family toxin [Enterovirga sp. DB1703]
MVLPDVNVLIYAFRADTPHHDLCRAWLQGIVAAEARFGLSPLALSAVVRITTNRRAFLQPSSVGEAFGFCKDLIEQPHCEVVTPGDRHWAIFEKLCIATGTQGPRVSDAWYAALAIEWGCHWITMDRDFARFPGLSWARPPSKGP